MCTSLVSKHFVPTNFRLKIAASTFGMNFKTMGTKHSDTAGIDFLQISLSKVNTCT